MNSGLLLAKLATFSGLMDRLDVLARKARSAYESNDKHMFHGQSPAGWWALR